MICARIGRFKFDGTRKIFSGRIQPVQAVELLAVGGRCCQQGGVGLTGLQQQVAGKAERHGDEQVDGNPRPQASSEQPAVIRQRPDGDEYPAGEQGGFDAAPPPGESG